MNRDTLIGENRPACGCTAADISDTSIAPGAASTVSVKVDISDRSGNFSSKIRLITKELPEKMIDIRGVVITDIWFNEPSIRATVEQGKTTAATTFSLHTVDYPNAEFDWTGLENGLAVKEMSRNTNEDETVIDFSLTADIGENDKISHNLKIVPKIADVNPFLIPVYCYRQ